MRISQLAERTDVPVHTLKYYLREGLLMPGVATSRTRAEYDEDHVRRVHLLRALVEHAGVGIDGARRVVAALEDPPGTRAELLGVAQRTVPATGGDAEVSDEVRELVADLGWTVEPDGPWMRSLTATVGAARAAGLHLEHRRLVEYAHAARDVAEVDLDLTEDAEDAAAAVRTVVLGTALLDPVLIALRRVAQEAVSRER
ncbi:MerR family transcriptional regulator [Phycicoccus sp. BSK3Z-2]|uniref:MerR family transcriptional regulator n=1 Tax=Phycicoccus avicenniae TaxID=2828860 RepID=A0A941D9P6_9MICO|nr:MerR family transcriptional regulator [Phycicoccus avicenniae]MBR7744523.1 MerR family transcriptional regulator [Phycicoccus avicenniae]